MKHKFYLLTKINLEMKILFCFIYIIITIIKMPINAQSYQSPKKNNDILIYGIFGIHKNRNLEFTEDNYLFDLGFGTLGPLFNNNHFIFGIEFELYFSQNHSSDPFGSSFIFPIRFYFNERPKDKSKTEYYFFISALPGLIIPDGRPFPVLEFQIGFDRIKRYSKLNFFGCLISPATFLFSNTYMGIIFFSSLYYINEIELFNYGIKINYGILLW